MARAETFTPSTPDRDVWLGLLAAALLVGTLSAFGLGVLLAVPVLLLLAPPLLRRPHLLVTALCVYVPVQYFLTKDLGLLPRAAVWLDELLVVGLALVLVIRQAQFRDVLRWTPINVPLLAFVGIGVVSAVLNQVAPHIAILGMRDTLQYVVVFAALAALPLDERWDRWWLRIAFAVGAVQAPIAVVQAVLLFKNHPDRIAAGDYDMTVGTFGPSGGDFVAYYVMFLLLLLMARVRSGVRIPTWVVPLLLVPFVASTSRLCFLFLPLGAAWLFRKQIFTSPRRIIGPILILAVAFAGLAIYYRNSPELMRMVLDPRTIVASQFDFDLHYVGRAVHYPMGWVILRDMGAHPAIGVGPGMYLGPTAHFFMVPATELVYEIFRMDPETLRFGSVDSGILPILIPYGLVGFLAFGWILKRLYGMGRAVERGAREGPDRELGGGFAAITLFAVFGSLGAPVWEIQVLSFYFWLFAGLTYRAGRRAGLYP